MAKVLLADDDEALIVMLSAWLKHENHHVVETASNGRDALDLLLTYTYDVVVLDWEMPQISGVEVCREFREKRPYAPVLMLTGRRTLDDKIEGLDAGADDYLTKPFSPQELSARVRSLLRRPVHETDSTAVCGAVTIDAIARTALVNGKALQLAPREFELLEFFIRHANQSFSPEALAGRVWVDGGDVSIAAVRMAIKRLRAKMEEAAGECPLKTSRGSGYIWEV
ncbi:MAG: response regulator transcription factor [Candidatus Melainabacteria bacterium]|jgi:DNA-binding response OmpR family regulator|nr:response regulator transcription factor [Candidatus Melainabacteria bacterium]